MGSRRHIGGAGDLVANPGPKVFVGEEYPRVRLVEIKACRDIWQNFRKADRLALIATAEEFGMEPWLAWVVGPKEPVRWLSADAWP